MAVAGGGFSAGAGARGEGRCPRVDEMATPMGTVRHARNAVRVVLIVVLSIATPPAGRMEPEAGTAAATELALSHEEEEWMDTELTDAAVMGLRATVTRSAVLVAGRANGTGATGAEAQAGSAPRRGC